MRSPMPGWSGFRAVQVYYGEKQYTLSKNQYCSTFELLPAVRKDTELFLVPGQHRDAASCHTYCHGGTALQCTVVLVKMFNQGSILKAFSVPT